MSEEQGKDGLPIVRFDSGEGWAEWLEAHGEDSKGLWLKLAKKGASRAGLSHSEALEVALCHGWIDGQTAKCDDEHWLQRFTPRTARSKWSRVNRDAAIALIERGAMRRAGLEQVARAKADGRWDAAYEPPSKIAVPDDLRAALEANPTALERFATLDSRNRYAVLYRVHDAKRPETRARRISKFVAMLAAGETIYP